MIVHAFDGSRIGCALLSDGVDATLAATAFVPYYTYSGNMAVSGSVGRKCVIRPLRGSGVALPPA